MHWWKFLALWIGWSVWAAFAICYLLLVASFVVLAEPVFGLCAMILTDPVVGIPFRLVECGSPRRKKT